MRPSIRPDPGREPPRRQPAAKWVDEWLEYERLQGKAPNTMRRFQFVGRDLVQAAGDWSLPELTAAQYQDFVDQHGRRCAHFVAPHGTRAIPHCKAGLDGAGCPMLTGDPTGCPRYRALSPATMSNFITALEVFNRYLLVRGHVASNPVTPVRHHFRASHRRALTVQRNRSRKVTFTLGHIQKLLEECPEEHVILYYCMAKWGLRPHEVVKLRIDPEHWMPKSRLLKVPEGGPSGDKRMGNPYLPLDEEADRMIGFWLKHRQALARDKACPYLLLTERGTPWTQKTHNKVLSKILKKDCNRLHLVPETGGHYTPKAFRYFFSKTLEDNECSPDWVKVLRGDQVPGPVRFYWDPDSELHRKFDKYGPKLF
jgi:integrase